MRAAPRWLRSLRARLLVGTLLALLSALVLSGLVLSELFREHVTRQFTQTLVSQLDQVTARLEFDAAGRPTLDESRLSDPRWSRPLSGLYWQVQAEGADAVAPEAPVLRSRSWWDTTLTPPERLAVEGQVEVGETAGPAGARLLAVRRMVEPAQAPVRRWQVWVAADLNETQAAVDRFNSVLAASLAALLLLLGLAAAAQVVVGLAPLRRLQRALADVQDGREARVEGPFPAEVQPLVDHFNAVLDRNAEIVSRARTMAGNLAHAIKTPLTVMAQAAAAPGLHPQDTALAAVVSEQVRTARQQVDWHLKRARVAAAQAVPGARVPVRPAVEGLVRVLERVHGSRGLHMTLSCPDAELAFAGEEQDLQEIIGNVLDNACKWARRDVTVHAEAVRGDAAAPAGRRLRLVIDDDGPGIEPRRWDAVLARGTRLDESVPGSGLGLAIVSDLVDLYGGTLALQGAPQGGLRVLIELPRAAPGVA